ncbi:MAG: copper amine oxidase N-terminal domain-containing protein [Defluviitaleaceae bacterium]|nr:copper amine oxidase N-terminal domain-containing protein [Defluviitaleaceae bacterium]
MRFAIGSETYEYRGTQAPLEAAPFIDGGRTMVPLRAIATGLGAEIYWDEVSRTVSFSRGEVSTSVEIDSPIYDNENEYLGTSVIVNGRTFVPLRHISQIFGMDVRWDEGNQAIYIY